MAKYTHVQRALAKIHGVDPKYLSDAIRRDEEAAARRHEQFVRSKNIADAHAAGRHCGYDCQACAEAGRTY